MSSQQTDTPGPKRYKLMGADRHEYESETPGTLGGNRRLKIYGRLDCPSARRALPTYAKVRTFFADEATAIAAGYHPCGTCLREKYNEWKATHPERQRLQRARESEPGPIALGNGAFRLATGREVYLVSFLLTHTYEGHLEGSPETLTPHIRTAVPRQVATAMPPGRPLVFLGQDAMPLPEHRLIAELYSRDAARLKDPDYASRLYLCWFLDTVVGSLDDLVLTALARVDWEASAEDFDTMP
jgi:hypothetical protein